MSVLQPTATIMCGRGMVASIDHLASQAGVAMLRAGGSAIDAAVATSAVLAVTSPHACGMGGDLFAIVAESGVDPVVMNASGRAGSGADPDQLRAEDHEVMPMRGIRSVTVPGCVDGWLSLHERYGRLSLADVLAPARDYAEFGFPASPTLAASIPAVEGIAGAEDLTDAGAPFPGTWIRRGGVSRALGAIAAHGRAGFYEGEFGEGLIGLGQGLFTAQDLRTRQSEWTQAISTTAWGHRLWTAPPNSQGYLTLAAAWIAAGLDVPLSPADPQWAHLLIESAGQAAFDRLDVLHEGADGAALIDPDRLSRRRDRISPREKASLGGRFANGDTIALCVVDEDRTGVSLIQSNAAGFGAHVVVPGARIFLHNRGIGFSLAPGSPNELAPGRRPAHTLSPLAVTTEHGELTAVAGTMGGDSQPQVLLQLMSRCLVSGEDPGSALAAGRWVLTGGTSAFETWSDGGRGIRVLLEGQGPAEWAPGLRRLGHQVDLIEPYSSAFGHAHVILADGERLIGATDPRPRFGSAAGF
jgi:gamma-glutamyltranspeptidase / glutathione hydrolase